MTTLTEFWPTVPSQSDAQLKEFALVIPSAEVLAYLEGQDSAFNGICKADPRKTNDGKYILCADLLREWHPATRTGLYGEGYDAAVLAIGDQVTVEDWTATIAKLPPSPPVEDGDAPLWIQPSPGTGRWFDMGYPFGAIVRRTIDGVEYQRRSLIEFNTVDPAIIDARYWEFYPPQAIPWKAGQVWNLGDVVQHVSNDLPENDTWQSKINANTTEPNTDAGFYRYWDPIGDSYDPAAPKEFVSGRAYAKEEKCIENGNIYRSILDIPNVWAPSVYPTGWELTGPV